MLLHQYLSWPFILSGVFGLLLEGCASKVGDDIKIPMGELALHDAISKKDGIAKLEMHIREAENYNMPFLAPHYYREASKILKDVQSSSPSSVSSYELARGDVILDKGEHVIDTVKSRLGKELDLKDKLDKQNAGEVYSWRYRIIISDLSKLIDKIEMDRAGNIDRDIKALNENMQALYDKVVQYNLEHANKSSDNKEKSGEK